MDIINLKMIRLYLFLLIVFFSCQTEMETQKTNKTTIPSLDLERYMGTWYEIARNPHRFEKGLVGVTATYALLPDGKISVTNKGYENTLQGKLSVAQGKAKLPDKNQPGRLKVSFFWIFYADYFIFDLDANYQWALIGSSSDNYLWILSRTPGMDEVLYQQLLDKLRTRGYDTGKLGKVLQPGN